MRQMKAMVERDLAALRRVSLAARVCFARAKNPSGSSPAYQPCVVAPNGSLVATADYGRIIASATHLRGDLDALVRGWKMMERREFESEVLFWYASIAGTLFVGWGWYTMFRSGFLLPTIGYFVFMALMFATHFRTRMAQRSERLELIEQRWHEKDIPGMIAALRSGDIRWTRDAKIDYCTTSPIA